MWSSLYRNVELFSPPRTRWICFPVSKRSCFILSSSPLPFLSALPFIYVHFRPVKETDGEFLILVGPICSRTDRTSRFEFDFSLLKKKIWGQGGGGGGAKVILPGILVPLCKHPYNPMKPRWVSFASRSCFWQALFIDIVLTLTVNHGKLYWSHEVEP